MPSPSDPFILRAFGASDNFAGISYKTTAGLTVRSPVINPSLKTLVLIITGQSLTCNTVPTYYAPTNTSVIDNANIYDGALYSIGGPLLGNTFVPTLSPLAFGNLSARLADKLVPTFDRIILMPIAIGSTAVADWATGDLANRFQVAMARLASRGIVPGMAGVTFATVFSLGAQDQANGTSQAAWTASFNIFKANILATGFNGRIFVTQESWNATSTYAPVRAAQAAAVDNITVFSAGDMDTLIDATNRQANAHFTDVGADNASTLIFNAMHASGAPF